MDTGSTVAICTSQAWRRCRHADTAVETGLPGFGGLPSVAVVTAWRDGEGEGGAAPARWPQVPDVALAGLAAGVDGRVYRADRSSSSVLRERWAPGSRSTSESETILAPEAVGPAGDFGPADPRPAEPTAALRRGVAASALAVSPDGLLALVDVDNGLVGSLLIFDLVDRSIVPRRVLRSGVLDVALVRDGIVVLVDDGRHPLVHLPWGGFPRRLTTARPAGIPDHLVPSRVAASTSGVPWILWSEAAALGGTAGGTRGAGVTAGFSIAATAGGPKVERIVLPALPGARDLEIDGRGGVVIAGPPGADLTRFSSDRPPVAGRLRAPGYDGRGLARAPDGRIVYHGGSDMRTAFAGSGGRVRAGHVVTPALDGGVYGRRWGRVFVDACLPPGSSLRVAAATADIVEPEDTEPGAVESAVPAVPSQAVESRLAAATAVFRRPDSDGPWTDRLHRTGSEPADTQPVTYECVVGAPPGRFLWLRLDLEGGDTAVPRVLALRAEKPAPHLLDKLPAVFSADPVGAGFLHRYLHLLSGAITDLDRAAEARHILLDPSAAPSEMLPWLASLVGLVLDDRWPESARRELIGRAVPLFRGRGTVPALTEMIRILLGVEPVLVEQFRYRGIGDPSRVGSGYERDAHRFTVVVPGTLAAEQQAALRDLLGAHRPAHTLVEICTAGSAGVGRGLHLGLTSVIGADVGLPQFTIGGRGAPMVLGPARPGLSVGSAGLGRAGPDWRVSG